MDLVQEFSFNATIAQAVPVGTGPIGNRVYMEVTGGEVTGERIRGKILGGGEWALFGPDGFARLDVRFQVETHDGAYLYFQYLGLLELNDAVHRFLSSGTGTDYGDQYFYINPRIETGDQRYAWLNTTFFIGEGHLPRANSVEYRVWRPA